MRLSRDLALWIHWVLDELLPPALRDHPWFVAPAFRLVFGRHAATFATFKERAPFLSDDEIRAIYEATASVHIDRETDLNAASAERILARAEGPRVLDAGCGRGWLARRLADHHEVTGVDFVIPESVRSIASIEWVEASLAELPFADDAFDTVVCTHTLEHVRDLGAALDELRRVARRRLIVVVPRQRAYRHTFDLHLHFFPTRGAVLLGLKPPGGAAVDCSDLGGDWYYEESLPSSATGR